MLSQPFASSLFALCGSCSRKLDRRQATVCDACGCVRYCDAACRAAALSAGHSELCPRLRLWRQRDRQLLADLPFDFAETTAAEDFDDGGLARFLLQRGLLGRGMWRRECYAWLDVHSDQVCPLAGDLDPGPEPFALPEASLLQEAATLSADSSLSSWRDYYSLRGFGSDSPICVLLQWPLTLYHLLFCLLPRDSPNLHRRLLEADGPLLIHVVGAEKEAELVPAFKELPALAPGRSFELALIGKELSPSVHKCVLLSDRLKVTMHRGVYHKVAPQLPRPHLVVAFNAGFAASVSWPATLQFLRKQSVPTYVTDYCEYSMELSGAVCSRLQAGTLTPPRANPFRSPIRLPNEQLDLPSYSNAFVSELVYPSD